MNISYFTGKDKQKCFGCVNLTRGVLLVKEDSLPFPLTVSMCPRCRDTDSKHRIYEERLHVVLPQHIFSDFKKLQFETLRPQKGISFWDMSKEEQESIMKSDEWIADSKIDGARGLLYFVKVGKPCIGEVHLLSSRISKRTGTYSDRSLNFPQITQQGNRFQVNELNGTVLDGEVYISKKGFITGSGSTDSTLNETVACMNASSVTAMRLQHENDAWAEYFVFDCLKFKGEDLRGKGYRFRRAKAEEAVSLYNSECVKMLPSRNDKQELYNRSLAQGYEGVVLKDLGAPYYAPSVGARNKGLVKMKRMETYDGFVTGYIAGEAGFKGLVGALLISAYDLHAYVPAMSNATIDKEKDPHIFEFAAVSNIPLVERKAMTAQDGSLKKEYYGRVIEVRAQTKTRTGRLRHATLLKWRPDKTPQECYYKVKT